MKTKFTSETGSRLGLCLAISAAALLPSGLAAIGQAAFPVGTWDCVMSGPRQGVAYLTFTNVPDSSSNFTFTGFEIIVPKQQANPGFLEARNDGGEATRHGFESSPAFIPGTQLFGNQPVRGTWSYDEKRRVIGYFVENSIPVCTTNVAILDTNTFLSGTIFSPPLT